MAKPDGGCGGIPPTKERRQRSLTAAAYNDSRAAAGASFSRLLLYATFPKVISDKKYLDSVEVIISCYYFDSAVCNLTSQG
jgi:hypothetical protein